LAVVPKSVVICTAGSDFKLRIFNTDLEENNTVRVLQGHRSYINQISWEPEGDYLASVSDDHTCVLWKCKDDFAKEITFNFKSAVMSAKWHPDEPGKLLVAEKCGLIHLFNVETQQAILSVEYSKVPLMYADWALNNSAFIVAVTGGDIVFWDLKKPARPADVKQIHEDCGQIVKFSPHTESIVASIGRPNTTLKIMHSKSQIPQMEASLLLYGGMAWHNFLPYIAAGQDSKLCFWKIVT
jgi:nuclear pore complex protein Nup37